MSDTLPSHNVTVVGTPCSLHIPLSAWDALKTKPKPKKNLYTETSVPTRAEDKCPCCHVSWKNESTLTQLLSHMPHSLLPNLM